MRCMRQNQALVRRYLRVIRKAAYFYNDQLRNKVITYDYMTKSGSVGQLSITFGTKNFMHLCGVVDYKDRGPTAFFKDVLKGRVNFNRVFLRNDHYFKLKMGSLKKIEDLLNKDVIGIVEDNVIFSGIDFGKMVRSKKGVLGLGTVWSEQSKDTRPLSLINMKDTTNDEQRKLSTFQPILRIRSKPMPTLQQQKQKNTS